MSVAAVYIRHRTRQATTDHVRSKGILVYRQLANVQVPDCCWLPGYAESNGLAGRILPQDSGGFRALKWMARGGYTDLGIFSDCQEAIRALDGKKKF